MIGRALAYLRGDVAARRMTSYGREGTDAYDLVDTLPPGPARAAAWNAYVCQTYADKLCSADEVVDPDTAPMVRTLYGMVGSWLELARAGSAGGELVLPAWPAPVRSARQLAGMRETLTALRTHVAFELGDDDPRLDAIDHEIRTAESLWIARPTPELRMGIAVALDKGIRGACTLGRTLAAGA